MRVTALIGLSVALTAPAAAGPPEDFAAAYAAAESASKESLALKTQWTVTVSALHAAQAAAQAGKFDDAIALARLAEALAKASIAQAKDQQATWTQGVIR